MTYGDWTPPIRRRVLAAIWRLAADPTGPATVALVGRPERRLRVGDWRVLYEIDSAIRVIAILRVRPRSSAYRN